MSGRTSRVSTFLAAAGFAAAMLIAPATASAQQTLVEFLWGGAPEYGGSKRQVVSFDRKYKPGQIVVSFGDRRLYHILKEGQAMSYPIAVPREQSRWEGVTSVSMKRENPDWRPTPEMIRENPRLPSWVPGGHPMNPMGVRALYLGSSTYRIHGTDAPWTIGEAVSKGCIRMLNEDVLHLYPLVPTGTKVIVTWQRFQTGPATEMAAADETRASTRRTSATGSRGGAGSGSQSSVASTWSSPASERAAASTTARKAAAADQPNEDAPKEGFFILPDDEANPVQPEPGMVTRYTRRVGAGAVSRAAEQKATQVH